MADKLWIMVVICGSWRLQVDHGSYRWILAVICMWIMAVINYGVDARGATASKKYISKSEFPSTVAKPASVNLHFKAQVGGKFPLEIQSLFEITF